jgi:hypothetical protein
VELAESGINFDRTLSVCKVGPLPTGEDEDGTVRIAWDEPPLVARDAANIGVVELNVTLAVPLSASPFTHFTARSKKSRALAVQEVRPGARGSASHGDGCCMDQDSLAAVVALGDPLGKPIK